MNVAYHPQSPQPRRGGTTLPQADAESGMGAGLETLLSGARKAGGEGYERIKNLVRKHPGKLAGAGGLLAALGAASEFADTDDPIARNASEAAGNLTGGLGMGALGTAIGGLTLGPVGALAGGALLGSLGSGLGSDIAGGLYDAINQESPEDRELEKLRKQRDLERQMTVADRQAMMPLEKQALEIKRADDIARMERNLAVQNDYNFANTLNTSLLNGQQNAAAQQAALSAYLFS